MVQHRPNEIHGTTQKTAEHFESILKHRCQQFNFMQEKDYQKKQNERILTMQPSNISKIQHLLRITDQKR
jgi:hypothetical protein